MGNCNSGRRKNDKAHLFQLLSISINDLKLHLLNIGAVETLKWSNGSQIQLGICDGRLIAAYATVKGESLFQEILLTHTPCNYGKSRTWMVCGCGKRVGTLYMGAGKQFVCRICTGLAYRSQALGAVDRGALTLSRLKAKLDPKGKYDFEVIPKKPKGMHISTYQQIEARIQIAYDKRSAEVNKKWGAVLDRLPPKLREIARRSYIDKTGDSI